jgi:hypothetical protein
MARYQRPPDPRDPRAEYQDTRKTAVGKEERQKVPWLWFGLGVLATLIGIIIAAALVGVFLIRQPLAVSLPTPTIIRLTAPPGLNPTATALLSSATPLPTFTPPATPDLSIAPEAITVGYYAEVTNTEDIGVSLRGGPSTDNIRLSLVPEGEFLVVIGGPEEGSGFIWWQVRQEDGTEGWVAGDFLVPVAAQGSSPEQ